MCHHAGLGPEIGAHQIVFVRKPVDPAAGGETGDLAEIIRDQPLQRPQRMGAVFDRRQRPAPGSVLHQVLNIVDVLGFQIIQIAEQPPAVEIVHRLDKPPHIRIGAGHEQAFRGFGTLPQHPGLVQIGHARNIGKNMDILAQCRSAESGMIGGRRLHQQHVNQPGIQHFPEIGEPRRRGILFPDRIDQCHIAVTHRGDCHRVETCGRRQHRHPAMAESDHAQTYFLRHKTIT
ncbi:hypothetical protein SDC9_146550 [bioreactor metagenome]|uniref:Uncharacterized protein n=1 Tax=bioreactor metagenome TaxID=1076179 RepID=A0A645EDF0_9ZZZZ